MPTDFVVEKLRRHNPIQAGNESVDIRFRCPHCQKLYRTTGDVFNGQETPEFDCSSCEKSFKLINSQLDFGLFKTESMVKASFEACPKCQKLKRKLQDECPSCGVFVSKFLEAQKSDSPLIYELNVEWQKVLESFHLDESHQKFINLCQQRLALNFAFQKYSDLQKNIGFDTLCARYITQIQLRVEQQIKAKSSTEQETIKVKWPQFTVFQWLGLIAGSMGLGLLIYNKFVPTFPNINGLVMLITLGSFGYAILSQSSDQNLNKL